MKSMSIVNFYTKEGTEPQLASCYDLPDCPICFEKCNPCYVQCPNGHTCCERHHVQRVRAIYEEGGIPAAAAARAIYEEGGIPAAAACSSNAQHCFECRTYIPDSSFSQKYFDLLRVLFATLLVKFLYPDFEFDTPRIL